jgi:hypothetical protein
MIWVIVPPVIRALDALNMELMPLVFDIFSCSRNGNLAPSTVGAWWWMGVKEQRTRVDAAQLRFILSHRVSKGFPTNFHGTHPIP